MSALTNLVEFCNTKQPSLNPMKISISANAFFSIQQMDTDVVMQVTSQANLFLVHAQCLLHIPSLLSCCGVVVLR